MKKNIKNIIFPIEFNHFTGGMVHSVADLANGLSSDYNVYCLAGEKAEIFQHLHDVGEIRLPGKWFVGLRSPLRSIRTYLTVRKLLMGFDPKETLIITNNVGSELTVAGFGILPPRLKRVFVSRGGEYQGKTGTVLKHAFKSISFFIATSEIQRDRLIDAGVLPTKIKIINDGIDIKPNNTIKECLSSEKIINISVIGYFNKNKNQLLAVEVISQLLTKLDNVRLHFYGEAATKSDKDYLSLLTKKISSAGVANKVFFHGFVKSMPDIYNRTDILLSTSLSEGFGRVIVEAMAYGIPCVGLRQSGGLRDIITDKKDGYLASNDSSEIAEIIEQLIVNPDIFSRISLASRLKYKNKFTKNIMVNNYKSVLEGIKLW